jgi:dCTP deaminase
MTVLSGQSIRAIRPAIVEPFVERSVQNGMSYGLSVAGYDIRSKQYMHLEPGQFVLLSSIERFQMPNNIIAFVHDKSTWARRGIAVQNTVIEPGWNGYLTMELTNHGREIVKIAKGDPIAQIVFHWTDMPVEKPYSGKYQNQEDRPVEAKEE